MKFYLLAILAMAFVWVPGAKLRAESAQPVAMVGKSFKKTKDYRKWKKYKAKKAKAKKKMKKEKNTALPLAGRGLV